MEIVEAGALGNTTEHCPQVCLVLLITLVATSCIDIAFYHLLLRLTFSYTAPSSGPRVSIDRGTITAQSVRLTLSGCHSSTVGPFRYIVTYRSDSGNELTVDTATSTSPPSLLTVTDLRPGKQYSFRVRCENSAGITGPSVSTTVTTSSEGLFVYTFLM